MSELPKNWELRKLSEVVTKIIGGGTPSKDNPHYWSGSIPWMSIKDMRTRRPADTIDHITKQAVDDSATNLIPADTVIMATRVGLGKVARVPYETTINQDLKALVTSSALDKAYLEYWLLSRAGYLESIGSGTTVKGIRLEQIRNLEIPLPHLPEQRRIVARIEELFSRLDAGVAALRHAKAQLQRYRQSVLAAAVTGQLTQAWREQHPDTEPAKDLLERILKQRREHWNGRGKYKAAPPLDAADLPDLPSSWAWGTTTQIFSEIKDGTHDTPKYQASGIPFITQKHIKPQGLVFDDYKYISKADHDHFYTRSNPEEGDILISMIGVNRGQSCIVPSTEIFSIKNVGLFKPHRTLTNVKFLQASISSLPGQQRLLKTSKGGAQPFVGLNELRTWALPLPPLAEQNQIVAEVEARTTAIDHLEAELDRQITRSNRLRQSALASAFSGQLR